MPDNDRYEDDPTRAESSRRDDTQQPTTLDEIESRADLLMAKMAAQRHQRQAPPPEPDGGSFGLDVEPETAPSPSESPVEREPAVPIGGPDAFEASDLISERPMGVTDDEPDEPERQSPSRRMALPPWQSPPSPMGEINTRADTPQPSTDALPPSVDDVEQPNWIEQHPFPAAPPPPGGWPPGGPMPLGNWQLPPPGWTPGLPPPPGWRGLPPWMPPPEPLAPRSRGSRPRSPEVFEPRDHRHDAGPQRAHGVSPNGYGGPRGMHVPPSLDEADVLGRHRPAPESGWRRLVHRATRGRINPGLSRRERERQELLAQIQRPIVGDFRIAVLSIKGGVGKTATTLGLGSALATVRTDSVIAVDANPDRGTLAERVRDISTVSTVRDLLRDPDINRYADVRNHTRMTANRLEVLASEQDPAVAEVFGETDYRQTMDILGQYYNVILTDCGTGIMHSAMNGVLDLAHAIVLVSSPAIDAALSASATLDWMVQHGYGALVRDAHVVFSASRPGSEALKLDKVSDHFEARCGSVHVIPFEPHLAEGAEFDFGLLKPATSAAYLELAGAVSEDFSRLRSPDGAHSHQT